MKHFDFAQVLRKLEEWRAEITEQLRQAQNDALPLKLEVDAAIECLRMCADYGISRPARVVRLPERRNRTPSSEYRLMEDQETDDRQHWIEVEVNGEPVRPAPFSVLVEPHQ